MPFLTNVKDIEGSFPVALEWLEIPVELTDTFHKQAKLSLMVDFPEMSAIGRYFTTYNPTFDDVGHVVVEKIVNDDVDFITQVEKATGGKLIGICHNFHAWRDHVMFVDGEAVHLEITNSPDNCDFYFETNELNGAFINGFYIQNTKQLMSAKFNLKVKRLLSDSYLAKFAKVYASYYGMPEDRLVGKRSDRPKHLGDYGNSSEE